MTCSPTLPEHETVWAFKVRRFAAEHPLTLRETTFYVEVTPLPEEPAPEPEPVIDPFIPNFIPFFTPEPPKNLTAEKVSNMTSSWIYKLPKTTDINVDDEVKLTVELP